jgi:hypothetical protein
VSRALTSVEGPVASEVAATKRAWRVVANGLPADTSPSARPVVQAAAESSARLVVPALLEEPTAASLTGPGSGLAGLFQSYSRLSERAWQLIDAMIEQIEHGSSVAARFARANVALYLESVYDAHFTLAQIGKALRAGYRRLGGPAVFGTALSQAEVDALADAYSEAADRLHPHVGVRLGS